jgi:hypothetical protein
MRPIGNAPGRPLPIPNAGSLWRLSSVVAPNGVILAECVTPDSLSAGVVAARHQQVAHDYRILREATRVDPEWAVIDQIWTALTTPYSPDARLMDLTSGQRAIYALTWIRSEVAMADSTSDSGSHGLPPAGGGRRCSAPGNASLGRRAQRALSRFPSPYPRDRQRRQELLGQLPEDQSSILNSLDDEFYDLAAAPSTSLDVLFRRYIEEHDDEF